VKLKDFALSFSQAIN